MKLALFLFIFMLISTCFAVEQSITKKIRLCEDNADWPPFIFFNKDKSINGFTVEMVKKILKKYNINYSIELTPLARCMSELEKGKKDIGMDVYFDTKRAQKYIYSNPYYQLQSAYFYSKKNFPQGLNIKRKSDFRKYHGCGISGYTYEHFDLSDKELGTGARDQKAAISMVKASHCDYLLEEIEIMKGFKLTQNDILADPEIAFEIISDVQSPKLYLLFSKKSSVAPILKSIFDKEFSQMNRSGELRLLMKKYVPSEPVNPH